MNNRAKTALSVFLMLVICFGLCGAVPVHAHADTELPKLLTTTSTTPVATQSSNDIYANTSTAGCSVTGYGWYDAGGQSFSGTFTDADVRVEITVSTAEGYVFSPDVAVYLNNERADFTRSEDGRTITLWRSYAPALWAPTIIKHPGNENVDEGGLASFVSTANYVKAYQWELISPDGGTKLNPANIGGTFPDVTASGGESNKLNIYNVAAGLDGWKVRCSFIGYGGSAVSNTATINVKNIKPTPTPAPTPEPTPEAAHEPEGEGGTAGGASDASASDGAHEHSFSELWAYDENEHWHQCVCGEMSDKAGHDLYWTVIAQPTKKEAGVEVGECAVCGYRTSRELQPSESGGRDSGGLTGAQKFLVGVIGIAAIGIVVIIGRSAAAEKKRRRRRRRRY